MEEGSTLKLIMERGPREGETLEFRSGSVIRLGRVVRGNSVAIKDSGISSKHLSIQFETDSGKWTISDLDSSNGTILNGTQLLPQISSPLSDGDTIKLGECTSIKIKIETSGNTQLRRNPRRRAAPADTVGVVAENQSSELGFDGGLGNNVMEKPNRRGCPRKARGFQNEVQKSSCEVENVKKMANVGPIESNQGWQGRLRRTRSSKKEENAKSNSVLEEIPEDSSKEPKNFVALECKKRCKGMREKRKLEDETLENVKNGVLEKQEVEENLINGLSEWVVVLKQKEVEDNLVSGLSDRVRVVDVLEPNEASRSGVKDDGVAHVGEEPDLEKMTLGEWFGYLEVYLPKQICDETEEIISGMRQRAKQFHEFMIQQKSVTEKGKSPMG